MERRFRVRLAELLRDAEVRPGLLRGMLSHLDPFLQPFVEAHRSSCTQTCGGCHKLAAEGPQTKDLFPSPDFAGWTLFQAVNALGVTP
jgi:hypothetical protein